MTDPTKPASTSTETETKTEPASQPTKAVPISDSEVAPMSMPEIDNDPKI